MDHLVYRTTYCGWNIGKRTIQNTELVFVTAGQGKIAWDDRTVTVSKGDLVCFVPDVHHRLWVEEEPYMEFYGMHFTEQNGFTAPDLPRHFSLPNPQNMQTLFRQLMEDFRHPPYMSEWKQDILIQQILHETAVQAQQVQYPTETLRIQKSLALMQQEPCRSFPISELCDIVHLKKSAFMDSFRKVTGTSPGKYMMQLRLERARNLLIETDLSVAQIAAECRFSDPFYFSRCFSRHYLTAPCRYRFEHL